MKPKCLVFIATSFDGYIAKIDGDIEWLNNPEYAKSELNGIKYEDFISTIDLIVMGRNTYEKVLTFGFWPYENTPVLVLTSKTLNIPDNLIGKIEILNNSPEEIMLKLQERKLKKVYIDGGKTIQNFLKSKLIDELIITQIPILLGNGIPLFEKNDNEYKLELLDSQKSENGFVQSRYKII
ncbi:MAG: dihydrofolate reductase family protein [Candidatus Sericytochromatia bacterium]